MGTEASSELNYQGFVDELKDLHNIGITAPAGADGDSVGTQCALRELLLQIYPNKKIRIINEDPCPVRYKFLPQAPHFEVSKDLLAKKDYPDCLICVDGGAQRIGDDTTELWKKAKKLGQVDHHVTGAVADYQFRLFDAKAASTTEIVFKFTKALGLKLTPTVAQAIYVGLIFDTGLFKHSNTRPETLHIGADLLAAGFNHTDTAEKAMLIRSEGALKMLKQLLNGMNFEIGGRYVWGVLDYKAFMAAGGDADDREGLIDNLFLTRTCEIAAFYFEKKPNEWKISFRARGHDVAALAQGLTPHGGGHKLAAECSLEGPQAEILGRCHQAVRKKLG